MPPFGVVEAVDVQRDVTLDIVRVVPLRMILEFELERREEALSDGVVPAVSLAAHAAPDTVLFEDCAVVGARVVDAAVAVMDQAVGRGAQRERALESGDGDG